MMKAANFIELNTVFKGNLDLIKKYKSQKLFQELFDAGYGDFLKQWARKDQGEKQKNLEELIKIDRQIKTIYKTDLLGLPGYLKLIRQLLLEQPIKDEVKYFEPPTIDLRFSNTAGKNQMVEKLITRAEREGIEHLDKIGLVLVAGGLGERLQSCKTKVSLKIHYLHHPLIHDDSFLGFYLKTISALEYLFFQKTGKTTKIPLFIMSSPQNHEIIKKQVRTSIRSRQITIISQIEAPCIKNLKGDLAIDEGLIKKPLGHGFVHTLIYRDRYLNRPQLQGKEYLFFLQDTNPLSVNTLLSSYGLSRKSGYAMSWVTVDRFPGEQAGTIVGRETLKKKGGREDGNREHRVVNIEYNMIEKMGKGFDINKFFANTNNFWLKISDYRQGLENSHGVLPFMLNPKTPLPGSSSYKPFRPETLMQDIAEVLPLTRGKLRAAAFVYSRHHAYSPVKNPLSNKKLTSQSIIYTSLQLEIDNNRANLDKLRKGNIIHTKQETDKSISATLAPLFNEPKIILDPIFKLNHDHLNKNIRDCTLHPQSLLLIKGFNISLKNVTLESNSALLILLPPRNDIHLKIENMTIANHGFSYIPLFPFIALKQKNQHNEEEINRGYRIEWDNPLVLKIDKPGRYRYKEGRLIKDNYD